MRLDVYVAEKWPEHSRSTWQKLIAIGAVKVDGVIVESVKKELVGDSVVEVDMPKENDYSAQSLPIIYEDDNVIVINKPLGVLTHSKGALNDEFTVASFFKSYSSYNSESNRPGIIHRLDRATSGVLIGAKNAATAKMLQRQFTDRKVRKNYVAVVDGIPKESEAVIDAPIGRNPKAPSTFRVDINGKSAETYYKVVKQNKTQSLVELSPTTGRTHQLRVHMAYINTPIRGDIVYGKAGDRLYLHAHKLEITIPEGQRRVFEAPIPKELSELSGS